MAKRSLKASSAGIAKAKRAFERREWTQEYLASAVGLQTRQSVWKFFSGRPIERHLFIDICFQLDLDWQDVAELPNWEDAEADSETQIEALDPALNSKTAVSQDWQWLREKMRDRVVQQCGTLQSVFSSEKSARLEQVYTELSLLPSLNCHRWIDAAKLQELSSIAASQSLPSKAADSLQVTSHSEPLPIQDLLVHSPHLLIYGKPGSGKTALLQFLALQHLTHEATVARVPIFLSLRHIADKIDHLSSQQLEIILFEQCQETGILSSSFQQILNEGQFLVLLDGLDELSQKHRDQVAIVVQGFVTNYPGTSIVMTCRLGVSDFCCPGFRSVELADLSDRQIESFVQNWFAVFGANYPSAEQNCAQQFLDQLSQPENRRLQDFARTPLFLQVLCWIFQEQRQFPQRRSRVYYTILELLLVRWDRLRNVSREEASVSLDFANYMTLLSQIAGVRFEAEQYFFEKKEVLSIIFDYLMQLPESSADCEALWLESEAVLKVLTVNTGVLIERAYEVYSFSQVALQEYLTARRIFAQTHSKTADSSLDADSSQYPSLLPSLAQKLNRSRWKNQHPFYHLANQVFDPRWHEVIRLTIDLVPNNQLLLELLKQSIDRSVLSDINLRSFVQWLDRKASEISVPSHSASVLRAFYCGCKLNLGLDLATKLDQRLMTDLPSELAIEAKLIQLSQALTSFLTAPSAQQIVQITSLLSVKDLPSLASEMSSSFEQVRKIVQSADLASLEIWCQTEGIHWTQQLQNGLMHSYDLGYNWEFTSEQQKQIESYYWANVFLLDCLRQATPSVMEFRKTFEMSILSPTELRSTNRKVVHAMIKENTDRRNRLFA